MPTPTRIRACDAKTILGEVISRVQFGHERMMLTRNKVPAAVIVSMTDYAVLEEAEEARRRK